MSTPSEKSLGKMWQLVKTFTQKTGTMQHPDPSVTEGVVLGLAQNVDEIKKPLCPCRYYPDKMEEIKNRTWICPCDDMQIYKYCHCLLFTTEEGLPITEHLPLDHEGRLSYGLVKDPTPNLGRAMRDKASIREEERKRRPS
jgi:ferredoxin-thioredoxin reductase catalytic chain